MPDTITTTPAGDGAVKLTPAMVRALRFAASATRPVAMIAMQNAGIRMGTMKALSAKGLVDSMSHYPPYTITHAGRAHPALAAAPGAETDGGRDDGR